MFEKNLIDDIVCLSEEASGLQKGSIRWGLSSRKMYNQRFMCVHFSFNGKEFINILSPVLARYKSDDDMADDLLSSNEVLLERVPVILSTYGMINIVQNMATNGIKFVYVMDPKYIPESSRVGLFNTHLN